MNTKRIIDANTNRAAEGMRVLEDIARFILEQPATCEQIKIHRHAIRRISPDSFFERNTGGDVGTQISTDGEMSRESVRDIAIASGHRVCEALRVIEECQKLSTHENTVERIRYDMYDLVKDITVRLEKFQKKQWQLCFVMSKDDCVLGWQETMKRAIGAGCDCVQVREKSMTTRDLIQHVLKVIELANQFNVPVIVNDNVEVMLVTNASGVHLGVNDTPIPLARKLCTNEFIIGATVRTPQEAATALEQGANYIGVGAMFTSETKPDVSVGGPSVIASVLQSNPFACHLAIGGITPQNVSQLHEVNCQGIAISYAIASSTSPEAVVEACLQRVPQTC